MSEELNYVRKLYQEVIKNFPDVKEDEIKIAYDNTLPYIASISADCTWIYLGENFFKLLSKEEQKVCIAHELGHYIRDKNNHPNKIKRHDKWLREYRFILDHRILSSLSKKKRHKKKRLQNWYILNECYADNQTIEAGYGHLNLKVLKRIKKRYIPLHDSLIKKEIKARIKNLEAKLGEENV